MRPVSKTQLLREHVLPSHTHEVVSLTATNVWIGDKFRMQLDLLLIDGWIVPVAT